MRPKEFNRNYVLEKCISLFWKNGFASCSVKDIVAEARINRFSLYKEFGNKDGILTASLELYHQRYSRHRLQILTDGDAGPVTIRDFFFSFFETTQNRPIGCFAIYIASELADTDPKIKEMLDLYLQSLEEAIGNLLLRSGFTDSDTGYLTKHLVGLFCNSMCYCVIQSADERESYVKESLDLIFSKENEYGS